MDKDLYKKPILYILLTVGCAGLVFVYLRFSPEGSVWFPKCVFQQLTGLKCPGCGSQRAVHNLLNLNIHKAFAANAFLVMSLPYIIALLVSIPIKTRCPKFYNALNSTPAIITVGIFVIVWWITRNVFGW